jgi:hypothetical protein
VFDDDVPNTQQLVKDCFEIMVNRAAEDGFVVTVE